VSTRTYKPSWFVGLLSYFVLRPQTQRRRVIELTMASDDGRFLALIAEGVREVAAQLEQGVQTGALAQLVDHITIVFDHLGPVLHFAKAEMHSKCETLKAKAKACPMLADIVAADRKAGTLAVKNSAARNLHRLTTVIMFMRKLLEKLLLDQACSLKVGGLDACMAWRWLEGAHPHGATPSPLSLPLSSQDATSHAYEHSLAPIHPYVVRTAVWAGMYVLPTREAFMQSLGESEASARPYAEEYVAGAAKIEQVILALYGCNEMPASEAVPAGLFSSSTSSWGSWGWGATASTAT
jgi:hypothetical protein